MDYIYYNWDEIYFQSLELAKKIKEDNYFPNLLVSLVRGGLLLTRLLSDFLKIKEIATLQLEYYKSLDQKIPKPNLINEIACNLKGKNILLCDDLVDTGGTMIYIIDYFRKKGCKTIKVATLHRKPHSKYIPDYFVEEVDAWIIYPWELKETINAFKNLSKSKSEIENELLSLGVEKEMILKLFDFMNNDKKDQLIHT